MAKKVNKKQIREENEMVKFIKTIIIVTIIFGLFYLLTAFINNKEVEEPKNNDNPQTVQYDEILIGNIFSKTGNYYVLVEGVDDKNTQVYEAYLSVYSSKKNSKRVYISKLDDMFNSKYIKDKTNLTEDLSELSFASTILLEIENGKIIKSYESDEVIRNFVKELAKEETTKE